MRLLAIYRHFWPDSPPYASMLRDITARLAAEGHDVSVLTEQPSYKSADREVTMPARENLHGVSVRRLRRFPGIRNGLIRKLDTALFPCRVVLHALLKRLKGETFDVIWTATVPPAINGLGIRIAARILKARYVYHFQDIYPELQTFSGNWSQKSLLTRTVSWIDHGNAKGAALCITLSEDMANTIADRGISREKIEVISNFMPVPEGELAAIPVSLVKPDDVFRIIFAGNIGRFQGLEALIDAAQILESKYPRIEVMLLGEGANLALLKQRAKGLSNVRFEGHMPLDEARPVIASADLGLVSIQSGIYRTAYPTKTLAYLELGVPILAVVESQSVLAHIITQNGLGWVAPGDNGTSLASTISSAYAEKNNSGETRTRVLSYYAQTLSREAVLGRWCALMQELDCG